jgi:D-aspartate ligase
VAQLITAAPLDASTPVLVLRRRLGEFQHGVLGVARSAGRLGVPVHSVRLDPREPATRSRYVRGELDLPRAGSDEDWIEALLRIGHELPGGILLPIDDLAAVAVGDHQQRLAERFRLPLQPAGLQRRLASKEELWKLCQELALPTATSAFPKSQQEATE